jgi:serine protein kinase
VSSLSKSFINNLQEDLKEQFGRDRSLMSFGEYLDEVAAHPCRQSRDTARYLYDAITSFGYHDIQRPYGVQRRYHIFDAPFDDGIDSVSGQEEVQCKLVGLLSDFVREGRSNRLILLNGPNGSAKTSMINCLQRGLEVYSASEEGALYTFSWLFPTKQSEGGGIGFGQAKSHSGVNSYSELVGTSIDARVANELRDHPLLLLPKGARLTFLKSVFEAEVKAEAKEQNQELDEVQLGKEIESRIGSLPRYLTDGSLSPQSATIFETLLKSYQGDISEVLKHIQVERFLISRRYRKGATTVDPQLRVDAQARQVTADRSLASLPASLQHLNLFEPMGHLVEGNRGIIEYNDLLKRPVEAFKYLLSTTENGAVRLDHLTIYIDAVMIGSCNFETLQAFIEMPDFASFKGRIELVKVPYLRDVEREEEVYQSTINSLQKRVFITPDVSHWLAKWAVMTRLERPQPVHFPSDIRTVIEGMTPHDKLELYSDGRAKDELALEQRRSLQREITTLYYEPHVGGIYEGWLGASPRELKGLLLSLGRPADNQASPKEQALEAALKKGDHFISPLRLFTALHLLCKEESVYPFLRRKVSGHFYQPKVYVQELKEIYLSRLRISFFNAFGLIAPDNELTQLNEYIHQLRYKLKGEKVHNPHTGQYDEPNEQFMREVEKRLGIKSDIDRARDSIIQQIAKWKIENPDADLDYKVIFEEELRALRLSYLEETEEMAIERRDELMTYLSGEGQLDDQSQQKAELALDYLKRTLGYHEDSLLEVLYSLEFSDA